MFLLFILKFPYGHVYRESLLFIIAYRQLLFGFPTIVVPEVLTEKLKKIARNSYKASVRKAEKNIISLTDFTELLSGSF